MTINKDLLRTFSRVLFRGAIGFVLGVALVLSVQYVYYQWLPRSVFFTWYSEDVVQAQVGVPLEFKSDNEVKINRPIKYTDTLFCGDSHGAFVKKKQVLSNAGGGAVARDPNYDEAMSGFTLDGFTLNEPAQCFLRSRVCMVMPLGKDRCQTVETQLFIVVPNEANDAAPN